MTLVKHKFANVVLGFIEPLPEDLEHSEDAFGASPFTSKAGGLPQWLYRGQFTPPAPPRCAVCLQPHKFLVQVYAPVESDVIGHDEAFHRVLYVSVCASQSCHRDSRCVSVIRAQLPRRNAHYPYDVDQDTFEEEEGVDGVGDDLTNVCVLCGFGGTKQCGVCHEVSYCGRPCQAADWKLGHKEVCAGDAATSDEQLETGRKKWRFQEFEVVTDCHPTPPSSDEDSDSEDDGEAEKERSIDTTSKPISDLAAANEGNTIAQAKPANGGNTRTLSEDNASAQVEDVQVKGTFQDADENELPEDLFKPREGNERDSAFTKFSKVVSYASDQVIRYEWNGSPLWAMQKSRCVDPGECELCGAKRVFELQVMPQLAYFLGSEQSDGGATNLTIEQVAQRLRNDAEWGTICVFSCSRSCPISDGSYVREFAWMQRLQ